MICPLQLNRLNFSLSHSGTTRNRWKQLARLSASDGVFPLCRVGCLPGSRRPAEGPAWDHWGGQECKVSCQPALFRQNTSEKITHFETAPSRGWWWHQLVPAAPAQHQHSRAACNGISRGVAAAGRRWPDVYQAPGGPLRVQPGIIVGGRSIKV